MTGLREVQWQLEKVFPNIPWGREPIHRQDTMAAFDEVLMAGDLLPSQNMTNVCAYLRMNWPTLRRNWPQDMMRTGMTDGDLHAFHLDEAIQFELDGLSVDNIRQEMSSVFPSLDLTKYNNLQLREAFEGIVKGAGLLPSLNLNKVDVGLDVFACEVGWL